VHAIVGRRPAHHPRRPGCLASLVQRDPGARGTCQRAKLLLLAAEGHQHRYHRATGDLSARGRPQTVRRARRAEILAATLAHPLNTWA
jgi:hypothetical protein